jgi:hypothetical protein
MTDTATGALITAAASLAVALASGGIALWNGRKTAENSIDIASLNGSVNKDLEKLKAKLSHGQLVNSTQWNAEFSGYQAIWKEMCAVRTIAWKLVRRESELIDLGLPVNYLASADRVEIRKKLYTQFIDAAGTLLLAIHNNAPFYPAQIREAANNTHVAAVGLINRHLSAFSHLTETGIDITVDAAFRAENETPLRAIIEGVDGVENLIRKRLSEVQVVNSASLLD